MRARVRRLEGVSAGAADVFELLKGSGRAAFLDSSLSGDLGRFSILGIDSRTVLTDEGGVVKVNGRRVEGGFLETARGIFGQRRDQAPDGLPLASGAIGYLSYDYGRCFERIGSHHPKELRMPDAQLVFYRTTAWTTRPAGASTSSNGWCAVPRRPRFPCAPTILRHFRAALPARNTRRRWRR